MNRVRRSELWEMRKSPAHYRYLLDHPKKQTPALAFGIASHKYILEGNDFWDTYELAPECDRRTKQGKALWQEFQRRLEESGKESLTISDLIIIEDMADAIDANPTAAALLRSGRHEVPIQWIDDETGVLCTCRVDCLTEYKGEKYIVDYKTTTSCDGYTFERSCRYYGYKFQAAMYSEGVFHETLEPHKFAFVAQEKDPPHMVRVYFCDQGFIDEGMAQYRELINLYHKCEQSGVWPGYEDRELIGDE